MLARKVGRKSVTLFGIVSFLVDELLVDRLFLTLGTPPLRLSIAMW